jgi:hypothetical protein
MIGTFLLRAAVVMPTIGLRVIPVALTAQSTHATMSFVPTM